MRDCSKKSEENSGLTRWIEKGLKGRALRRADQFLF
jgi:hypothetical protein